MTMNNFDEANSFLMGGGGRSVRFDNVGDTTVGLVVSAEPRQQTDFKTKEPKFWKDGSPQMQLVVTLQTDLREDEDDDGIRKLYVKGDMRDAVARAVSAAGQRGLAQGGKLGVKFVSQDEPESRNISGKKRYTAKYEAPVVPVGGGDDFPPPSDDDLPFHHDPSMDGWQEEHGERFR